MKRRGIKFLFGFIVLAVYLVISAFLPSKSFQLLANVASDIYYAQYENNAEVTRIEYTYKHITGSTNPETSDKITLYDVNSNVYNNNGAANVNNNFSVDKDQELTFYVTIEGKNASSAKICTKDCEQEGGNNYATTFPLMIEGFNTSDKLSWNVVEDKSASGVNKSVFIITPKATDKNIDNIAGDFILSANYGDPNKKFNFNISNLYYATLINPSLTTEKIQFANIAKNVIFSGEVRFITAIKNVNPAVVKESLNFSFSEENIFLQEGDTDVTKNNNYRYTFKYEFKNDEERAHEGDYVVSASLSNEIYHAIDSLSASFSVGSKSYNISNNNNDSRSYRRGTNAAKSYTFIKKYSDTAMTLCTATDTCEQVKIPNTTDFPDWDRYLDDASTVKAAKDAINSHSNLVLKDSELLYHYTYNNNGNKDIYIINFKDNKITYADNINYYNRKTVDYDDCAALIAKNDDYFNHERWDDLRDYELSAKYACKAYNDSKTTTKKVAFADDGKVLFKVNTTVATREYTSAIDSVLVNNGQPTKLELKLDVGDDRTAESLFNIYKYAGNRCPPENVPDRHCDDKYTIAKNLVYKLDYIKGDDLFPRVVATRREGKYLYINVYYRENMKKGATVPADTGTYEFTAYMKYTYDECSGWGPWHHCEKKTGYNFYTFNVTIVNSELYYYTFTNTGEITKDFTDLISKDIESTPNTNYRKVGCTISSTSSSNECTKENLIGAPSSILTDRDLDDYIDSHPAETNYIYNTELFDFRNDIFMRDVLKSTLTVLNKKGFPGNINYSQSLGLYAVDKSSNQIKRLDNYNIYTQIYEHNVRKEGDKYTLYDTTRYKIKVTDIDKQYIEDTTQLDETASTIKYKLYEYPTNSTVYEGEEPTEVTSSIADFRVAMSRKGLNVSQAFTNAQSTGFSTDLIDHIKTDDDGVYIGYGTGKRIVGYAVDNNLVDDTNTTVKVPAYFLYADGTTKEPKADGATAAVKDDFYFFIKTADFADDGIPMTYSTVSFEGTKPDAGSYVFEVPKDVIKNLSLGDLADYDVSGELFNITLNPVCEVENLSTYSEVGTKDVEIDGIAHKRVCSTYGTNGDLKCETYPSNIEYEEALANGNVVEEYFFNKLEYCSSESHVISPKTNVPKGTYFIYVDYNSGQTLGYETDPSKFPRDKYPELQGNNSHMTRLTYSDPIYTMTYGDVLYTSPVIQGEMDNAYENIINNIDIPVTFNYNYDENLQNNVQIVIEKKNSNNNWVASNNNYGFNIDSALYPTVNQKNSESVVTLSNLRVVNDEEVPVNIESGEYRIGITYGEYNGSLFNPKSHTYYQEFVVKGRYYNLGMEGKLNFAYYHNIAAEVDAYNVDNVDEDELGVKLNTVSIDNRDNINVQITSETKPDQVFVSKKTNAKRNGHTLFDVTLGQDGPVAFRYYFTDERIILEHVENIADIGTYRITLSYTEENNDGFTTTDSQNFYIYEDRHLVEIKDVLTGRTKSDFPEVYSDEDGMHIVYYVDCQYIPYEDKDNIHFEIVQYQRRYVDVVDTINYHFKRDVEWIKYNTGELADIKYQAKVTFTVNTKFADLYTDTYLFRTYFGGVFDDNYDLTRATDTKDEVMIQPINDLFKWNVQKVKTTATEHDTGDTELITNTVDKSHGFVNNDVFNSGIYLYNNLYNQSLEISLKSPRIDAIKWVSNPKSSNTLISTESNSSFYVFNDTTGSSAKDKKLKLYYNNKLYHTVESTSETVASIAAMYGVSTSVLANNNGIATNAKLTVGQVLRISSQTSHALTPGVYRVIVYYEDNNYEEIDFTVINNYADIKMVSALLNGKAYDADNNRNMFVNTTDTMDIDLELASITSSDPNLSVYVTDANNNRTINGREINSYFTGLGVDVQNKIHLTKLANNGIPTGDYILHIKYSKAETSSITYTKEVTLPLNVGTAFFSYEVGDYSSVPVTLTTGANGVILYPITVNNVTLNYNTFNAFEKNTKIYLIDNKNRKYNVTSRFQISTMSVSATEFYLKISYNAGNVENGIYYIETSLTKDGLTKTYTSEKDNYFMIGSYSKAFKITSIDYSELPTDNKFHNNLAWDVTYNYEAVRDNLFPVYMSAQVLNSKGEDVSAYFDITKSDGKVKVAYDKDPKIAKGEYTVRLTYFEHSNDVPYVVEKTLDILGTYKEINISNLTKGSTVIYADLSNQYYTFKVNTSSLADGDLNQLKAVIYDADDNVYYSDIDGTVTNRFNVTRSGTTFRINIVPYAARVGSYKVALYLPNEDYPDEYDESNFLTFTIDDTKYKVNITDYSINPKVVYNGETDKAYDKDGVSGTIAFTTTANVTPDKVKVVIYDGLREINTIDPSEINQNGTSWNLTFDSGEIDDYGDFEFAITLNGLPYASIQKTINKYIPVSDLYIRVNNKDYRSGVVSIPQTTNSSFSVQYSPANATDVSFTKTLSDYTKLSLVDNTLIPSETGETVLTIGNNDITKVFTIRVSSYVTSNTYTVDNDNYIIHVKHVSTSTVSRTTFESNLENLAPDRSYVNNGTNSSTNIATGDKLVNGGFTYTIVLYGDINRNGTIDLGDVSRLYGNAIGTRTLDSITKLATDINGNAMTDLADVSRLYRFVIGNSTGY